MALNTAIEYMRRIKECQTFKSCNIYGSCCETTRTCGQKLWVIDVDSNDPLYLSKFIEVAGLVIHKNVIATFPTVNGMHFIIKPFDTREWKDTEVAEIKKHNPITLLYYNDNKQQNSSSI